MFIIVAAVLLQNDLRNLIITDPFPNLIIPLWAIIAYMIIALKRKKSTVEREADIQKADERAD